MLSSETPRREIAAPRSRRSHSSAGRSRSRSEAGRATCIHAHASSRGTWHQPVDVRSTRPSAHRDDRDTLGNAVDPLDELERVLAEGRRPARRQAMPRTQSGRRAAVPASIDDRIRSQHAAGTSLGEIARQLNADRVPTAHGGAQWWPSTVRDVLRRAAVQASPDSDMLLQPAGGSI